MCTLDPGCNIPTLSHLIKYLYSKSLTRAMSLNVLIDINCGYQKMIDINCKYIFLVHHVMKFLSGWCVHFCLHVQPLWKIHWINVCMLLT